MLSPAFIVSGYYFLVFLSLGCILPFFALWFKSVSLTEQQIGLIAASPSIIVVLITVVVGNIADRAKDWRTAIIVCNWLTAAATTCLLFDHRFINVLVFWTLSGALILVMSPVLDAASIRMARQRELLFHKMRAWGSVGFIVGVTLSGLIFDKTGIENFLPLMVGLAWLRAVLSLVLPRFKAGIDVASSQQHSVLQSSKILRSGWFLFVLLGSALIHASHGYFYTFGTVIWIDAGYSATTVSLLWASGVAAEVAVMWLFSPIAKEFSARKLLAFAGAVACVRWFLFGIELPLWMLLLNQCLHGLTFGILFLATVNFIANWTPVSIAAQAQSLSAAINTGLLAGMTLLSGLMHESLGPRGYWVMLMMCITGIVLIVYALKRTPGR